MTNLNINEFLSLTILLLMAAALVSGQADADLNTSTSVEPAKTLHRDAFGIDFEGLVGDEAFGLSVDFSVKPGHFRGEDE